MTSPGSTSERRHIGECGLFPAGIRRRDYGCEPLMMTRSGHGPRRDAVSRWRMRKQFSRHPTRPSRGIEFHLCEVPPAIPQSPLKRRGLLSGVDRLLVVVWPGMRKDSRTWCVERIPGTARRDPLLTKDRVSFIPSTGAQQAVVPLSCVRVAHIGLITGA